MKLKFKIKYFDLNHGKIRFTWWGYHLGSTRQYFLTPKQYGEYIKKL